MLEAHEVNITDIYLPDNSASANLSERLFYIDCSPELARDRTKRAQAVANILNECRSFGTNHFKEIIRLAFQSEVEASKNAIEAIVKMDRLISLINLRLERGLALGPERLLIKDTLYFVIDGIAFNQKLALNLKANYKTETKQLIYLVA